MLEGACGEERHETTFPGMDTMETIGALSRKIL
jgi:hypothetical protein